MEFSITYNYKTCTKLLQLMENSYNLHIVALIINFNKYLLTVCFNMLICECENVT